MDEGRESSLTVSLGPKPSGLACVGVSASHAQHKAQSKVVKEQTQICARSQGKLKTKKLKLEGAALSSIHVDTKNLSHKDLKDRSEVQSSSISLSLGGKLPINTLASGQYRREKKEGATKATLSGGSLKVKGKVLKGRINRNWEGRQEGLKTIKKQALGIIIPTIPDFQEKKQCPKDLPLEKEEEKLQKEVLALKKFLEKQALCADGSTLDAEATYALFQVLCPELSSSTTLDKSKKQEPSIQEKQALVQALSQEVETLCRHLQSLDPKTVLNSAIFLEKETDSNAPHKEAKKEAISNGIKEDDQRVEPTCKEKQTLVQALSCEEKCLRQQLQALDPKTACDPNNPYNQYLQKKQSLLLQENTQDAKKSEGKDESFLNASCDSVSKGMEAQTHVLDEESRCFQIALGAFLKSSQRLNALTEQGPPDWKENNLLGNLSKRLIHYSEVCLAFYDKTTNFNQACHLAGRDFEKKTHEFLAGFTMGLTMEAGRQNFRTLAAVLASSSLIYQAASDFEAFKGAIKEVVLDIRNSVVSGDLGSLLKYGSAELGKLIYHFDTLSPKEMGRCMAVVPLQGTEIAKKVIKRLSRVIKLKQLKNASPCNVNAQVNLNKKMRALQGAQKKAVKTVELEDGRVRYYEAERPSIKPGHTRGSSYVTEYNTNTGQVRSWQECYNHQGNVNRIHPKMIDGQDIIGQHYPPTGSEINNFSHKLGSLK